MRARPTSVGATPARARSARPSSSISAKRRLIAGQSARSSRSCPVRTKSNASGAARSPYADIVPAPNGIRMRGTLRIFATCQQWTGPAPPKAKSGYWRRSRPRSMPWMRAAAAMFSLTRRWIPHTAPADLDQLDDGDADREPRALLEPVGARHLELAPDEWDAVVDHARLRGRAAHVEREELGFTALARRLRGRQRAGGGTGLDEADREASRERRDRDPARGLHDVELGRGAVHRRAP